ncbi:MAG TPA: YbaK/EbsC family protein [Candidatus Dormibacteraeota bacterium]|nr:YbaK/EbsC family protein [Candidatus Dormibacteraeota bacterium]
MTRFERWLEERGLEFEVRCYPAGVRTAPEAARSIGVKVGQIVKSLVFRIDELPVLVLMSGENRLDPRRLEDLAGGRVERADPEAVREVTGYAIGGVPPFGHVRRLATYMDRDLLRYDVVWAAAGRPDAAFAITPSRLVELTGARLAELRAEP